MEDNLKSQAELVEEIKFLKIQIKELEELESDYKKTKQSFQDAQEYAENIVNAVREPLLILNSDLKVVLASPSFYENFKVKPEDTINRLIYDLGNRQWDIPKLRELLELIFSKNTSFNNFEIAHDFADIGKRIMLLNAREIKRAPGKPKIILLAIEDATERKRIEKENKNYRNELEILHTVNMDQEKRIWLLEEELLHLKKELGRNEENLE